MLWIQNVTKDMTKNLRHSVSVEILGVHTYIKTPLTRRRSFQTCGGDNNTTQFSRRESRQDVGGSSIAGMQRRHSRR